MARHHPPPKSSNSSTTTTTMMRRLSFAAVVACWIAISHDRASPQYHGSERRSIFLFTEALSVAPRGRRGSPPTADATAGAFIRNNQQIVKLGKSGDWKGILDLYEETISQGGQFNNVNYATTMSQLGRIRNVDRYDSSVIRFIDDVWEILNTSGLEWMGVRETANIVHAIAKMSLRTDSSRRIVEFVACKENAAILIETGEPQNVANVCWSLAKLGRSDVALPLFCELEKHAKKFVVEGNPQNIANTAWSCATLGVQSPKLFAMIEKHANKLVGEGKPQDIAITAWACATLGLQSPTNLFVEIEKHASKLVVQGDPQAIANTAWACATLGIQSPKLFAEIEKHAKNLVATGRPQEIANTAWSCAALGVRAPKLFAEIEKHASKLVVQGDPQAIANTALSCAKLGVQSPKLFAMIEKHADKIVVEGRPQAVSNTAWSCATLRVQSPRLFAMIEKHVYKFVAEASPQNIANTAWSSAKLGIQLPKLFAEIEQNADKLIAEGNAQNIVNTLWACMITSTVDFEGNNRDVVLFLWEEAMKRDHGEFTEEELHQLAQILAFSAVLGGITLPKPPAGLLERIQSACVSGPTESSSQKQVSRSLTELGLKVEDVVSPSPQVEFLDSLLAIDMALPEHTLAIEFDGPNHFLRSVESGELTRNGTGPTQAKRRFLEKLGWKVMSIDYRDWDGAETKQAKLSFLRNELAKVGVEM